MNIVGPIVGVNIAAVLVVGGILAMKNRNHSIAGFPSPRIPSAQGFSPPAHQQGFSPPAHQQGFSPPAHQQGFSPPAHQQHAQSPTAHQQYYPQQTTEQTNQTNQTNNQTNQTEQTNNQTDQTEQTNNRTNPYERSTEGYVISLNDEKKSEFDRVFADIREEYIAALTGLEFAMTVDEIDRLITTALLYASIYSHYSQENEVSFTDKCHSLSCQVEKILGCIDIERISSITELYSTFETLYQLLNVDVNSNENLKTLSPLVKDKNKCIEIVDNMAKSFMYARVEAVVMLAALVGDATPTVENWFSVLVGSRNPGEKATLDLAMQRYPIE